MCALPSLSSLGPCRPEERQFGPLSPSIYSDFLNVRGMTLTLDTCCVSWLYGPCKQFLIIMRQGLYYLNITDRETEAHDHAAASVSSVFLIARLLRVAALLLIPRGSDSTPTHFMSLRDA